MLAKTVNTINSKDDKDRAVFRRLLLAKQLYLHGLEHSNNAGELDKMIAVHNFHNAIEIALRAIILHYDIRSENQLSINFEQMITDINNYKSFRDGSIILPYQREIKNLNQYRNFVQHHGFEPESSTMDYWRVFTKQFLWQISKDYFGIEFDELSPIDMVEDEKLKGILRLSLMSIAEKKIGKSITLSSIAFQLAQGTIFEFLPSNKILMPRLNHEFNKLVGTLEKIEEKIGMALYYAVFLSSGVKLVDYKKFRSITPSIDFATGGTPYVYWHGETPNDEDAQWAHDFVVSMIVHWQSQGLKPSVQDWCKEGVENLIKEQGISFEKHD